MSATQSIQWKLSEGSSLVWKFWDDEYVVFNSGSGDTHLLDQISGEALRVLEQSAADPDQLARRVASALNLEADADLARFIETALAEFHRLGLIDPADT